jgi:hypothetical protein
MFDVKIPGTTAEASSNQHLVYSQEDYWAAGGKG